MKIAVLIPARFASTRFEGKPLAKIMGKPMIQHVWEGVSKSAIVSEIIVATEDKKVFDAVIDFGGNAVMTKDTHVSGTDRIIEASENIDADIILNIQGDEPLVNNEIINALIKPFKEDESVVFTSVKTPIYSFEEFMDINNVKVVTDKNDYGIYFSRSPIPFDRNNFDLKFNLINSDLKNKNNNKDKLFGYKHLGFYGYRKSFLKIFGQLPPSYLEQKEMLEQLRAIENGYKIKVETVNISTIPVDVPADIKKVESYLLKLYN
ncbi:MAG: 3-deoxy-manno-octulosonate cytidylyltransferase [Deltaproteobacteria bacterium]|nr:3-deoxy-manno-octulosonate cytidylyltransferase [Deltaproteobacteria bacterium]